MLSSIYRAFVSLIRRGLNREATELPNRIDWAIVCDVAARQGLSSVAFDGVESLLSESTPGPIAEIDGAIKQQWIASVMREESSYARQWIASRKLGELFNENSIRIYVLKGEVISECYPNPQHRKSVDLDCYLLPIESEEDVWEKGNVLMERAGYAVSRDFYKNSTIYLPGLMVENHRFLTPFRGNSNLKELERLLQTMMHEDKGLDTLPKSCLCRPPVMVTSLFLIEHAYSHFLHEGLTWRLVLDWMMFSRRHQDEIDWLQLNGWIDEFGFREFYDSYVQLGAFLLGEVSEADLSVPDKLMMEDIWANLDLHESVRGLRGKLALAGNTFRARWKYRHFSEISWLRALWIQAKGVLFIRQPKL